MTHHEANLIIPAGAAVEDYAHITSVGGWVGIYAEGDHLPACTNVGVNVRIYAEGDHLRACTYVAGWVFICAQGLFGKRDWYGERVLLRNVGGFTMAMGRSHRVGDMTVHRARYLTVPLSNGRKCYVAERDGLTAHGTTVRAAIEDLRFKEIKRDPSGVIAKIRDTGVVTAAQFRAITGACRDGLCQGLRVRGLAEDLESLPLDEAVRHARGDEFGETFIRALEAEHDTP